MKTIDLKKYYHDPELYDESNLVVVTDEVAEVMDRSIMEEKSFFMRRYRAKAFYSLDYGNGIEHSLCPLLGEISGKDQVPLADVLGCVVKCIAQVS